MLPQCYYTVPTALLLVTVFEYVLVLSTGTTTEGRQTTLRPTVATTGPELTTQEESGTSSTPSVTSPAGTTEGILRIRI